MNNYIESHETVLCWPTLELHHDFESNKTTFKNCPIKKIRAERRFSLIQTSHHCLSSKWSILPSRREGFVLNWPVDAEWSVKGLFPAPIQSPGSWLNVRAQLGPGDWWQDSTLVRAAIKPSALRPVSFAHPGVFIYRAGGGETSTCPGLERMKKHLLREQFSTGSRMLETLKLCRWNVEFL